MRRRPAWTWTGWLLAAILPLAGAWSAERFFSIPFHVASYVAVSAAAIFAAEIGMAVAEWQLVPVLWIRDLVLAVPMGAAAWAVGRFGGGDPVDPALIAVLGSYLLILWPSEARRRWS